MNNKQYDMMIRYFVYILLVFAPASRLFGSASCFTRIVTSIQDTIQAHSIQNGVEALNMQQETFHCVVLFP
jgi:hypothetical protein